MCGEHQSIGSPPPGLAGSSPRVRGTRSFDDPVHRQRGIIPACAGNTDTRDIFPLGGRDHPRVCGEHEAHPALAGGSGDHPRVCGEHLDGGFAPRRCGGSSPRVRGTRSAPRMPLRCTGIIPACAGNTPAKAASPSRNRDHPRVCGEHSVTASGHACMRGSSPRVRGTRRMS